MSRKLVLCAVSVFALMTLVVSAQTQNGLAPVGPSQPPGAIPAGDIADGHRLWGLPLAGMGAQGEELELTRRSEKLAKELATAKGEDREKIRDKLTEALGKQFDLRQKRHEKEIANLEAQLKKLRETVQKRQDNRKEIISKRLDQLVRRAEGLDW